MSEKKTYVALVLDSSGSMSHIREQAIGMFNEQRRAVVEDADGAGVKGVTLVLFGAEGDPVQVKYDNVAAEQIPEAGTNYRPHGWTPMRDGIGRAITLLEKHDDKGDDTAFLVIVVTDGLENASVEWSANGLSRKVTELQNTGRWTFGLYGSDALDLTELKDTAGLSAVPVANTYSFSATAEGMMKASVDNASYSKSYFASRVAGVTATSNFTDPDKENSGDSW